jgi:hypothetical protein
MRFRVGSLFRSDGNELIDNLRPSGALWWKGEIAGREGRGVVCGKLASPRLQPPPVSVKNRWVDPCEKVLNVSIACWWYGPSKPSSLSSTEAWIKSTASLVVLGEKLGMDPHIGQLMCCRLCREIFFSGAVRSIQICRWLVKGCHIRGLLAGSVRQVYVDWHGKSTCHVDRVFPCRVYIDLNRCDSRIWVTAYSWQSSRSYLIA